MKKKQIRQLCRVFASGLLLLFGSFLPIPETISFLLLMMAYLTAGYDTLWTAIRNIRYGNVFDENFLMAIATIGAIGLQDYKEAVFVMLFYLVGTLFEDYAVNKSRGSISQLMDIRPDYANLQQDGEAKVVDPYDVSIGDIIIIKPGERVPLDGIVTEGRSTLDTSALTGEALPQYIEAGKEITSGCINLSGVLKVQVTHEFDHSTVSKILDMVENAGSKKAKVEKFITRFARYYTPFVVIAAVFLAFLPPLFLPGHPFGEWISRALIFLVISCPCALVISVPLAFFGGVGGASACGILVKGSNYLESLARVEAVVFDKTGTLTTGTFHVKKICGTNCDERDLLMLAAHAELYSNHPLSLSIRNAYEETCGTTVDEARITDAEELAGLGVSACVNGKKIYAGNARLMESLGFSKIPSEDGMTIIHIAEEGQYLGYLALSDTLKPDSAEAIQSLKKLGVKKTVMLTGDRRPVAEKIASESGLDEFYAELLPGDKVDRVEALIAAKKEKGSVVFVGDGINDAPVLARCDVGIAMGGLGSEAAVEASDVVIMNDQLSKLPIVMQIATKTLQIAKQNVIFALAVKFLVMALGSVGMASMWLAVFADVGVAVICILNSMRCLRAPR